MGMSTMWSHTITFVHINTTSYIKVAPYAGGNYFVLHLLGMYCLILYSLLMQSPKSNVLYNSSIAQRMPLKWLQDKHV